MSKYDNYIQRAKNSHGEKFDPSNLAPSFVQYYNSGSQIKVQTSYGETITGTVGETTGWKPAFLLIRRSNAFGSSDLLTEGKDRVIAIRNERTGKYVNV